MFLLLARVIYLIIFAPKSLQGKVKFVNKIIHNTRGCYQVIVNDNKLVVLGAGWLGEALCLKAKELGWQVQGTRREVKHDYDFQRQLILQPGGLKHTVSLKDAWWVCAIPPKSRDSQSDYLATLSASLELAKSLQCRGFILCSSTGVYNNADNTYTEQSTIECSSPREQLLYDAEQCVLQAGGKVLRLAGLVGPNREPGRFVAGKALQSSSQQLVNMVHRDDVIHAIFKLIEGWSGASAIYNVVNPAHPKKVDYYQQKCAEQGSPEPSFTSDEAKMRIIDGSAIESLGFQYQWPI